MNKGELSFQVEERPMLATLQATKLYREREYVSFVLRPVDQAKSDQNLTVWATVRELKPEMVRGKVSRGRWQISGEIVDSSPRLFQGRKSYRATLNYRRVTFYSRGIRSAKEGSFKISS